MSSIRRTLVLSFLALLSACGGGGGGGGGGSGGGNTPIRNTTLALDLSTLAISVTDEEAGIPQFVTKARAFNPPADGFAAGLDWSTNAIEAAELVPISNGEADVRVRFRAPESLGVGIYVDHVSLTACYDDYCDEPIAGSPFVLTVTTQVTDAGPTTTITVPSETLQVSSSVDAAAPSLSAVLTLEGVRPTGAFVKAEVLGGTAVTAVTVASLGDTQRRVDFQLANPSTVGPGYFSSEVWVQVCYDEACTFPRTDSKRLLVNYRVAQYAALAAPVFDLGASDIAWDATSSRIYAAIPAAAASNANSVLPFDPATGTLGAATFVGSNPTTMAISGDGSRLYVGLWGASLITRLDLPSMQNPLSIPVGLNSAGGPAFASYLAVAPDHPDVLAVVRSYSPNLFAAEDVVIYDGAQRRFFSAGSRAYGSSVEAVVWGDDDSLLYGLGENGEFSRLIVNSGGTAIFDSAILACCDSGFLVNPGPSYAAGSFYAPGGQTIDTTAVNLAGQVRDPNGNSSRGNALTIPDVGRGLLFAITSAYASSVDGTPQGTYRIHAFDIATLTHLRGRELPNFGDAEPSKLIRFGSDGLAILTTDGKLYIVRGSFVTG